MREKSFNPTEHIGWQESHSEAGATSPDIFNPESFISLEAVIDVEKAQITAEAIQQRLQPHFSDLATAEIMLGEAASERDRAEIETWIAEIKTHIREEIDKKTLYRDRNIGDILPSSNYAPILYWHHKMRRGGVPERRHLSPAELEMLERYDAIAREKALEFLREANEDQRKIFDFLAAKGFRIPDAPGVESEEDKRYFGDLFCAVANRVVRFSLPRESDEQIYEKFTQRFGEFCEGQKQIDLEGYFADPQVKETLRLWRWFGMEAQDAPFLGVSIGSRDLGKGGQRPGEAQYGSTSLDILYDASSIRETLKEGADTFIIPGLPERVQIIGAPFRKKMGDDLSVASQRAENLNALLKKNPDMAIRILGHRNDWVFANFQIDKVFEEAQKEADRSFSFLFLGAWGDQE